MKLLLSYLPAIGSKMLERRYRFIAIGFDLSFITSAATAALQAGRPNAAAR